MKTFKLKSLQIIEDKNEDIISTDIALLDGLTINREDDANRWIIEAYMEQSYMDFFNKLQMENDEVLIEVKITKESNQPATFLTTIIGVHEIGSKMNVLFRGTIVDKQKSKIQEMLTSLVEAGYQGELLLEKFKELL